MEFSIFGKTLSEIHELVSTGDKAQAELAQLRAQCRVLHDELAAERLSQSIHKGHDASYWYGRYKMVVDRNDELVATLQEKRQKFIEIQTAAGEGANG